MASAASAEFREAVDRLIDSNLTISQLEKHATKLTTRLEASEEHNNLSGGDSKLKEDLKLHAVMQAMIQFAPGCGDDRGKRYTLCAICTCHPENENIEKEERILALQNLGTTWVSHFLYICAHLVFRLTMLVTDVLRVVQITAPHIFQDNQTPSEAATPTMEDTGTQLDEGARARKRDFPTLVQFPSLSCFMR